MDIRKFIDNSLLKPDVTTSQMEDFLVASSKIGFYAVCIPPRFVPLARDVLNEQVRICSVVGFPMGYQTKAQKVFEVDELIEKGCHEIDVVINISALRSGEYDHVEEEVKAIVRHARSAGVVTKFIIETSLLSKPEIRRAVEILKDSGADFVKTSTGFGSGGATPEDVRFLKDIAGKSLRVKASGGIRDLKTALKMIEAGADRIGTSSGVSIYRESLVG